MTRRFHVTRRAVLLAAVALAALETMMVWLAVGGGWTYRLPLLAALALPPVVSLATLSARRWRLIHAVATTATALFATWYALAAWLFPSGLVILAPTVIAMLVANLPREIAMLPPGATWSARAVAAMLPGVIAIPFFTALPPVPPDIGIEVAGHRLTDPFEPLASADRVFHNAITDEGARTSAAGRCYFVTEPGQRSDSANVVAVRRYVRCGPVRHYGDPRPSSWDRLDLDVVGYRNDQWTAVIAEKPPTTGQLLAADEKLVHPDGMPPVDVALPEPTEPPRLASGAVLADDRITGVDFRRARTAVPLPEGVVVRITGIARSATATVAAGPRRAAANEDLVAVRLTAPRAPGLTATVVAGGQHYPVPRVTSRPGLVVLASIRHGTPASLRLAYRGVVQTVSLRNARITATFPRLFAQPRQRLVRQVARTNHVASIRIGGGRTAPVYAFGSLGLRAVELRGYADPVGVPTPRHAWLVLDFSTFPDVGAGTPLDAPQLDPARSFVITVKGRQHPIAAIEWRTEHYRRIPASVYFSVLDTTRRVTVAVRPTYALTMSAKRVATLRLARISARVTL